LIVEVHKFTPTYGPANALSFGREPHPVASDHLSFFVHAHPFDSVQYAAGRIAVLEAEHAASLRE
jgi:hypothetical protein